MASLRVEGQPVPVALGDVGFALHVFQFSGYAYFVSFRSRTPHSFKYTFMICSSLYPPPPKKTQHICGSFCTGYSIPNDTLFQCRIDFLIAVAGVFIAIFYAIF